MTATEKVHLVGLLDGVLSNIESIPDWKRDKEAVFLWSSVDTVKFAVRERTIPELGMVLQVARGGIKKVFPAMYMSMTLGFTPQDDSDVDELRDRCIDWVITDPDGPAPSRPF